MTGVAAIEAELWRPLRDAIPDAERRDLIVAGGDYQGADYVCLYSHIQGTFANDWLDIPANDSVVTLRCCEINRMADGLIVESHVLIDVLDLMYQAGCWPISPSLGAEGQWQPPASHDGVQLDTADPENGAASLRIVKAMHAGLGAFDGENFDSMHHAQYWTENFMWYGPSGIGTTRGLAGFASLKSGDKSSARTHYEMAQADWKTYMAQNPNDSDAAKGARWASDQLKALR